MPNLIPNVTEIFYSSNGTLLEVRGNALFHAQSNYSNLLLVYIEDGNGENTTTLINFSPKKYQSTMQPAFTSHWFFMNYLGETQETIEGELTNRSFSKFSINVPNSVLRYNNFNMNKDTVTVIQRYGANYLGTFSTVSALEAAYPDNTNYSVAGTVANLDALLALTGISTNAIYQVTNDSFTSVTSFNSISAMLASTGKSAGAKLLIAPLQQYYEYVSGDEDDIDSYRTIPRPTEFTTTAYKYLGNGISNFNNWQNVLTPSNLSDGLYTAYVIAESGFFQVISLQWTETEVINAALQTKQYNAFEISVNPGLSNTEDVTPIQTSATAMIMQSVANLEQQYVDTNSLLVSHLDDTANPHQTSVYNLIDTDVPEIPTTNGIILRYNTVTSKYEDSTSLNTAESNITNLQGRMTTAEGEIDTLQSDLDTAETDIDNLETRMDTAEGDIVALEGRMDTAESDIVALEGRMDTAESDIDSLETRVTANEGDITDLDNNKVEKNPTIVSSLSATDYVYSQQGGVEKRISVTNLKSSIIENLVAFGYVKFTEKDVDGQPVVASPQTNKIYLYNPTDSNIENDQFEEWIWVQEDNLFEQIGTTAIALQDYYDKGEVDALLEIPLRLQLYPNTKNTSGSPINKGAVVQFAGSQGDFIEIKNAVASEINADPSLLMGLARNSIADNAFGDVVWFGNVLDIATGSFSLGDILWFDTTTGGLTATEPTTNKIQVAAVEKASSNPSSTNGILLVRIKYVSRTIDDVNGLQTALDGKVDEPTSPTNSGVGYWDGTKFQTTNTLRVIDTTNGDIEGRFWRGDGIYNKSGSLNSYVNTSTNGTVISRNIANDQPALIVNQINASSTGDILKVQSGGTDRLTVQQGGNVGIGTTSPTRKLQVVEVSNNAVLGLERQGTSPSGFIFAAEANTTTIISRASDSSGTGVPLRFVQGVTESMRISATGNIGINQTSPTAQLEVKSSATDKVPLIVDTVSGQTANLQQWKVNNVTKAFVDNVGTFISNVGISNIVSGNNSSVLTSTTGTTISRNVADANDALTVNLANASSTGLILDAQAAGTTVASIAKDGTVTTPNVVATSTVKIGSWVLSQGTNGSLDFSVE